ncbi:hypothetical protein EI200_22500 [Peribacillus simplex]|uniref:hypothetical protein n=1 Tax=Peribacillus simplex TaxID=1478 RepID=UPI000F62EB11|nr:hypothetical protein [Peribacillus simplex]RRN67556.1 hypothetical protein EI200_22500 [Peribacillus simplex]
MFDSINSVSDFLDVFKLPIAMSLIGAIIGHYRKNGVIQWPIFSIDYEPGPYFNKPGKIMPFIRGLYLFFDFILYILGIHIGKKRKPVLFELGYFGDLLVGIGAGILAKCGTELADIENDFTLMSTSLLAGFAGMSYMLSFQKEATKDWEQENDDKLRDVDVESSDEIPETDNQTFPTSEQAVRETASSRSEI